MFVTGGGLRIDYLITRDGQAMSGLIGGNAIYSAVGARLWTDQVIPWTRHGDNYPADWLMTLDDLGLSLAGLIHVNGKQDHRTFYAYAPDGQRFDTNPEKHYAKISHPLPPSLRDYHHSTPDQDDPRNFEPLALRPNDWPEDLVDVRAVHLAPMPLSSHLSLPETLRTRGVNLITVDPGERYMIPGRKNQLKELLPLIDVILPSEQELLSLFGRMFNLIDACRELTSWGSKLVIIKLGDRGTAVYDQNSDKIKFLPAYHKPGEGRVVDVTGAGDAFCGGFLVGLYSTGDISQAIRMGSVSASIVVEGYGALYALGHSGDSARLRLNHLSQVEFY